MKPIKQILLATLLLSVPSLHHAQDQFSGWAASFHSFRLGDRVSIHFDGQFRSGEQIKHLQTLLLRPGLNVHLKKNMILSGGYGFISNHRNVSGVTGRASEHRFWQQFIVSHKINRIGVAHRFRTEQRLIPVSGVENNELVKVNNVYANRFRYFIRNMLPLQKEKTFSSGMFLALQNEVFLNFGNNSVVNGKTFDQNRFYLATGYRLNQSLDLEIGYMNQYSEGRSSSFTNNHILQVASYVRL